MLLTYNFDTYYRDGFDSIYVKVDNYKFNVDDSEGSYNNLHKKYENAALEDAAYKLMCEYADTVF